MLMALLAMLRPVSANANHAAGGEIIYVHISDSTYQFILKFYRDCAGPAVPSKFLLCAFNTCTNQSFNVPMDKWQGTLPPNNDTNGSPVTLGCAQGATTQCQNANSTTPGFQEWWYSCIVTIPLKCNYWRFGCLDIATNSALCCRNATTNLVGTPNFFVETTFNPAISWENSSPYYSVKPVPYVCINTPYTYNNGALDADGDSLWSQMVNPLVSTNCNVTPAPAQLQTPTPPINFNTNPFQTNNTFNLFGNNGQMSFTPAIQGKGALSIKTREFRNGAEIGSIMRDVQVQVLACSTTVPVLTKDIAFGGIITNGLVYGCVDQKIEFCFDVKSTDTEAILLADDNLKQAIPKAKITYTNVGTDSLRGCFSWTPELTDVGRNSFVVIIKDSTCKPPGIMFTYSRIVELHIWGPVKASPDTSICSGEPAFLGVSGGGDYEWTVLSGTPGNISNPLIPNPVAQPKVTTTYQVTSRVNPYCSFNKDTVVINVLKGPDMVGQKDDTTCPNTKLSLSLGIDKQPGVKYSIKWKPATGLSSDTIEQPVTVLKNSIVYTAEVSSDINRCKTLDTAIIDVLKGLNIENGDTQICIGQYVDVKGIADSRYSLSWSSKNDPTPGFVPASVVETRITPSQVGVFTYRITGNFQPKCPRDTVAEFDIDVQPVPVVAVDDDASMCYGDTMQMHGSVMPAGYNRYNFSWSPGHALDFPDRKNPIFSAIEEGVTTLTFRVSTPAGCIDSTSVTLNVLPSEFISMPADTAICPGDSLTIRMNLTKTGVKYYWLPDVNISSVSAVQPTVWPVAGQKYSIYGVDELGCRDTSSINIAVKPAAVIEIPEKVTIYSGESYTLDPGGNCLYYSWFPPLGLSDATISNPSVSPRVNTRYVVHAANEAGCRVTDSIDVIVVNDANLDLPNAFNPAEGKTLRIIKRGNAELHTFNIYNRWGVKVFETNDINEGWNGTYKGELQPVGVYLYNIRAITNTGRMINKQGNITLIR